MKKYFTLSGPCQILQTTILVVTALALFTPQIGYSLSAKAQTPEEQLYSLAQTYSDALLETAQPAAYYYDLKLDRHDKFIDNTPEGRQEIEHLKDTLLTTLQTMDPGDFSEEKARVFYANLRESLEADIEKRICKSELWDVNHMSSPHQILDLIVNVQPVQSDQDKQDTLNRWRAAAGYYLQEINNLKSGLQQGYSAPQRVVGRVITQLDQLTTIEIADHPYMQLAKRANNKHFEQQFAALLENQLLPSIETYLAFLKNDYLPMARTELGIHALPKGRECYMALYRGYTSLKRTPEQVFELGLKTVNGNMGTVNELGKTIYGTSSFADAVKSASDDKSQKFSNGEEMHDFFVAVVERAKRKIPAYFMQMPSIEMEVEAVPQYQQGSGISAHYVPGSEDRKAKFAYDPTTFGNENFGTAEIVSVHEGYPGHHMQIALVQGQDKFHPVESVFSNSAYVEGWARYAEELSEEAGIYQSKSAKILRRSWPARGMVADTALHIVGWSNERVANFIKESGNSLVSDTDVLLDRMAAIPAQLTSYDSGGLEIFALREQLRKARGDDFDIKEFHRLILKNGSVPMAVLKQQVMDTSH